MIVPENKRITIGNLTYRAGDTLPPDVSADIIGELGLAPVQKPKKAKKGDKKGVSDGNQPES